MVLSAESEVQSDGSEISTDPSSVTLTSKIKKNMKNFGGVMLVALTSIVIWDLLGNTIKSAFKFSEDEIPLIRADRSPIKVIPENPGGMHVPNRGKFIYETLEGNKSEIPVERLLPPGEEPISLLGEKKVAKGFSETSRANPEAESLPHVPKSKVVAAWNKNSNRFQKNPEGNSWPTLDKVPSSKLIEEKLPPIPPPAPSVGISNSEFPVVKPLAQPPIENKSDKVLIAKRNIDRALKHQIQIAATRSESAAKKEWARLRKTHLDILGDLGLNITRVDLGGTKGVYFRLRLGPIATDGAAQQLCNSLKSRKVGCLVIRPQK
tara:strand:- start:929 stop:1891 length:963 start_codon:yes stop_codon:yes gene_type:complete